MVKERYNYMSHQNDLSVNFPKLDNQRYLIASGFGSKKAKLGFL